MDTMSSLYKKKILLGVSGSIAAYKAAYLVREFVKKGAEVKVVMTKDAIEFITPLTLATLSGNGVYSDFTEDKDRGTWSNHVELGLWADIFLIAPATANTISKMAHAQSDNFLLATYLSARCEVFVAPAMDLDMHSHPGTTENLATLEDHGVKILDPGNGELASGLSGKGRLQEPDEIVVYLEDMLSKELALSGKRALVTAGPTWESIDPVRFIGNRSSGKMGIAVAEALAQQGARVELVCGPSSIGTEHPLITRIDVESAEEMYLACNKRFTNSDIAVLSAAVADYKPKFVADQKIKKSSSALNIELVPTQDILASLGKIKKPGQILVGFALETNNAIENAKSKLERKNLDFIVLNSLEDEGAGFSYDTNKITLVEPDNKLSKFELKSKTEAAKDIVNKIISLSHK